MRLASSPCPATLDASVKSTTELEAHAPGRLMLAADMCGWSSMIAGSPAGRPSMGPIRKRQPESWGPRGRATALRDQGQASPQGTGAKTCQQNIPKRHRIKRRAIVGAGDEAKTLRAANVVCRSPRVGRVMLHSRLTCCCSSRFESQE